MTEQLEILRTFQRKKNRKEEQEDYYKPVRIGKIWSNIFIEYESNGYRNKTLSSKEYLNEIKPCLNDIINNLKKPGT